MMTQSKPNWAVTSRVRRATVRFGLGVFAALAIAGGALASPVLPDASQVANTAASIAEASQRFGIPADWIRAVMGVESAGSTDALSRAGAMGLMQLMPATYSAMRSQLALGANPYDPHDNILAGAAYLRQLLDQFGEQGFLAAYNAGPGRYAQHLNRGRRLPAETRAYVAKLEPAIRASRAVASALAAPPPVAFATTAPTATPRATSPAVAAQLASASDDPPF